MTAIEFAYKKLVRPLVFSRSRSDAETAHRQGIWMLKRIQTSQILGSLAQRFLTYTHPMLRTRVFGIDFENPFGLAAGFDKHCEVYWGGIPLCGWGFTEVGGITRKPQIGNPRPRLLRSQEHRALWNWMGFNNPGVEGALASMCESPPPPIPVGLNVGKGKDTKLKDAPQEYAEIVRHLWLYGDFFVLNVSSPNTEELRELQVKSSLEELVRAANMANHEVARFYGEPPKPLGIKISPDETDEAVSDMVSVVIGEGLNFIIAVNTTVRRDGVTDWKIPADRGGVSGRPLKERSLELLKQLRRRLKGRIPLISVGGIENGDDLVTRILFGADLCEALTAWPFEGPDFARRSLQRLVADLYRLGFTSVGQAVGTYA